MYSRCTIESTMDLQKQTQGDKKAVDESVKEVKEELKTTVKEIQKQREEMQVEGGFRKFMFWATPILLFAQSIAMALLLLR